MRCEQARELFNAYLDGELSGSLATELGAHRVRCSECRRALALLEVSGHILASDPESEVLQEDFTDRLIACMATKRTGWLHRARRVLTVSYVAGPLAAAAIIALAFLGAFDGRTPKVAGEKYGVDRPEGHATTFREAAAFDANSETDVPLRDKYDPRQLEELEAWLQRTRDSGETIQQTFNLTILQVLDVLDEQKNARPQGSTMPNADRNAPVPSPGDATVTPNDVEDL